MTKPFPIVFADQTAKGIAIPASPFPHTPLMLRGAMNTRRGEEPGASAAR